MASRTAFLIWAAETEDLVCAFSTRRRAQNQAIAVSVKVDTETSLGSTENQLRRKRKKIGNKNDDQRNACLA
jgi:hypothetical protein